ncbi:hypothetical protein D1007_08119 [Hordeum vulgare]|nr:hypothetical protein D1007_08119 [Hordeum vulgare]
MDDDLDAAAGLASLASSDITTAPSRNGKPRPPQKIATAPKKKKELTREERAWESAKGKGRRHASGARDEVASSATIAATTRREDTVARVEAATREVLLFLWLKPRQHGLLNAAVAAASTCSSALPWMALP